METQKGLSDSCKIPQLRQEGGEPGPVFLNDCLLFLEAAAGGGAGPELRGTEEGYGGP